jgi:hypothetical protein
VSSRSIRCRTRCVAAARPWCLIARYVTPNANPNSLTLTLIRGRLWYLITMVASTANCPSSTSMSLPSTATARHGFCRRRPQAANRTSSASTPAETIRTQPPSITQSFQISCTLCESYADSSSFLSLC